MNYDVMDLDKEYWVAMMSAFFRYGFNVDHVFVESKDFCKMYCGG